MKRDYRDYLEDIVIAIDETAEFTTGMSYKDFSQDRKTINAVVRSLEVLGEAAKHIPDVLRNKAPKVPWRYMAGMRDKLIHEYFGLDLSIVWTVINDELPPLRQEVKALLDSIENNERSRI
jgi:uncharacterized protein with HEPN domain